MNIIIKEKQIPQSKCFLWKPNTKTKKKILHKYNKKKLQKQKKKFTIKRPNNYTTWISVNKEILKYKYS